MSYELTDDLLADIRNLFISRAAFLAGSKPKQSGVDVSLLKLMINNAAGNGFAFEVSDDSKQMLLAGNESVSGAKTWLAAAIFQAAVTMNAAVAINAALTLAGNILANKYSLNEITTPTAVADKGALYTKSDNKFYFQDGAGVEHEVVYPISGSFEANFTGFDQVLTRTWYYNIIGNAVTLQMSAVSATSNAITMTVDNLPAAITPPAGSSYHLIPVYNNTANAQGLVRVQPDGTLLFGVGLSIGNFTNSGEKGLNLETSITYYLF